MKTYIRLISFHWAIDSTNLAHMIRGRLWIERPSDLCPGIRLRVIWFAQKVRFRTGVGRIESVNKFKAIAIDGHTHTHTHVIQLCASLDAEWPNKSGSKSPLIGGPGCPKHVTNLSNHAFGRSSTRWNRTRTKMITVMIWRGKGKRA